MEQAFDRSADDIRTALDGKDPQRVCVLCVGDAQRQDYGFGPVVAQKLREKVPDRVFDCGPTVERDLARAAQMEPRLALLVDAVRFGGLPGEVRVFGAHDLQDDDLSSQAVGLSVAAQFMAESCGASVLLIAVQPGQVDPGPGLTPEVRAAAEGLTALLGELLTEPAPPT